MIKIVMGVADGRIFIILATCAKDIRRTINQRENYAKTYDFKGKIEEQRNVGFISRPFWGQCREVS